MKNAAWLLLGFVCSFVLGETVAHADPPLAVVAHRGLLLHAPENTLANFRGCLALRLGFEFDVARASDGELVCIHDATVDRTTDGSGRVDQLTLPQLKRLDAGKWFDAKFAGERIPTVAEVLDLIATVPHQDEVLIAVDIKVEGTAAEVARMAEQRGLSSRLLFIGLAIQEDAVRQQIKAASPAAATAALAESRAQLASAIESAGTGWVYLRFIPTAGDVDLVHRRQKRVFIAGSSVSGREQANWLVAQQAGTDAILTDYPLDLAASLRGDAR